MPPKGYYTRHNHDNDNDLSYTAGREPQIDLDAKAREIAKQHGLATGPSILAAIKQALLTVV